MTLRETFTSEYMENLKRITFQLKNGTVSGGRRKSRAKGQSLEFSDFRNYVIGDNVKNIDWKSYGRLDKLFVKLFLEERQANINIILDCSGSMGFGKKGMQSKLLCACLGYMFMLNMDRVNIFALENSSLTNLTTSSRVNQMVDFLDNISYGGENKLVDAVKSLELKQGSCIIISDFFTDENKLELCKLLGYKKQKIYSVMLLDQMEINPEILGDVTLKDNETNVELPVTVDKAVVDKYKKALDKHIAEVANATKKTQGQFLFVTSDMQVLKVITDMVKN